MTPFHIGHTYKWERQKIEDAYNPEFDIPAEPEVTWVDHSLLLMIEDLLHKIESLHNQLQTITNIQEPEENEL